MLSFLIVQKYCNKQLLSFFIRIKIYKPSLYLQYTWHLPHSSSSTCQNKINVQFVEENPFRKAQCVRKLSAFLCNIKIGIGNKVILRKEKEKKIVVEEEEGSKYYRNDWREIHCFFKISLNTHTHTMEPRLYTLYFLELPIIIWVVTAEKGVWNTAFC